MEKIKGGVTASLGFLASHTAAGIKYKDRDDMAMIYSEAPCNAAGVFTTNVVKAAPVQYDREIIDRDPGIRSVVINAGIANACTGADGLLKCRKTADFTGRCLNISADSVLLASTGVIGMSLPLDKVKKGVEALSKDLDSSIEAGNMAAKAIMTTDTHEKESAYSFTAGGRTCHIGGMTKGAGMIHPNLGTMLCFITTDCAVSSVMIQKALKADVRDTFNMISVDGDTSTNDTCVVIANGMAENDLIDSEGADFDSFKEALFSVMHDLCIQMAGDGEGATTLIECRVENAGNEKDARTLAKSVITSNLTKAAVFGRDANWGRILCALGYSGAFFDPDKVDLYMESKNGRIKLIENGTALPYSEDKATEIMKSDKVIIIADMKSGSSSATAWGCDLTYDYVKINADYRS